MEWHEVRTHWGYYLDQVKQKWPKLTHHDLEVSHGDRSALVSEIAKRYKISRDEALEQLYDFEATLMPPDDSDEEHEKTITEASFIGNMMKPGH